MWKAACPQKGVWMVRMVLCAPYSPVASDCFASSTFYKAASAPEWTGNVFTVTKRSLSVFVCTAMDEIKIISLNHSKSQHSTRKKSILISKLPLSGTHVWAMPLTESSSLPFDTSSAFQTLVYRSLPIWKEHGCTCSPGVRLYPASYSSCLFIKISFPVHIQWDPGLINSRTGFYSTEKWDRAHRSRQMNQLMLLLALEEILACLALYNLRPQTWVYFTSASLPSWLPLQLSAVS